MRVVYTNAYYRKNGTDAGSAHVRQFITNTVALGHELWLWGGERHPATRPVPSTLIGRLRALRRMDVIFTRIEDKPRGATRWAVSPYRQFIPSPFMVWEFNTVPEFGALLGRSEKDIQSAIEAFRYYGRGCDLATCVSRELAAYVREHLGIRRVLVVPNGSDPSLFRPGLEPVNRIRRKADRLNIVWIGSAHLDWNNFDLLRRAAEILWERSPRPRIAFHIIGQDFKSIGDMPPNVHYYGRQSYDDLPRWLAGMDVGLCLYRPGPADFGSPVKLFDYMSSGLAVVGTFHPQIREIFNKLDQADLLVGSDDPLALAEVLVKVAGDPQRVRRQGDAGRRLVVDYYNWERGVRDTFREIELLAQGEEPLRHYRQANRPVA
jgi:glycosyltransferase involved in cell wall biosynthesis